MRRRSTTATDIWLLSLILSGPLSAQIGGSGSIQGVVSDPSGAVIPGANVVAANQATDVRTTRHTTDAGFYSLSPLAAGTYSITISAPGFQVLTQENIVVDALNTVGFNAILKVGTAGEQVTVTDSPPALSTADFSMSQTIRNDVYTALPLAVGAGGSANNIARDPTNFVMLMPGVTNFGQQGAGSVSGRNRIRRRSTSKASRSPTRSCKARAVTSPSGSPLRPSTSSSWNRRGCRPCTEGREPRTSF